MNQTRAFLSSATILTLAITTGCASTTLDRDAIQSVDRAALIGFQGLDNVRDPDESSKKSSARWTNIATDLADGLSGREKKQLRRALNGSYDQLVKALGEGTPIAFLPRKEVADSEWYEKKYDELGDPPGFRQTTTAKGIIAHSLLTRLSQADREEFMDELGVEAVATARITWITGDTREAGISGFLPGGKRIRPAANVEFIAWKRGHAEPVWVEAGIRGCPSEEGIEDFKGFAIKPEMAPILKDASERGYVALLSRYNQALESDDGEVGVSWASTWEGAKCR